MYLFQIYLVSISKSKTDQDSLEDTLTDLTQKHQESSLKTVEERSSFNRLFGGTVTRTIIDVGHF